MSRRTSKAAVATLLGLALLLAGLVTVAVGRANAIRSAPTPPAAFNAALRSGRMKSGAPGAEAAIVACGQVVWAGADGVTDLRSKRRVTNGTPFVIASTTKTVTATMVMQQVQAGKLSLNTPLARFYPKLPNAKKITVRMLLNMTSGLPEDDSSAKIQEIMDTQPRHRWTRNEILAALGKPLFPPGKRFEYTNTNYTVLGGILEQVAETPIEPYFQRNIATRAGMTSSTWTPSKAVINRMAHPYERQSDGSLDSAWIRGFGPPTYYYGPVFTAGGLVSTATDLARFGNALLGARLVSAATLAQMTQLGPDNYGLGVSARNFDRRRWLGHNGSFGGYESENFTDPKRQLTITVTTNGANGGDEGAGVAEQIGGRS